MSGTPNTNAAKLDTLSEDAFQAYLLEGVSRTFALTIPRLPPALMRPVSNAYLLCRIVDTIEDEVALTPASKRTFCEMFSQVVKGLTPPEQLVTALHPLLSEQTLPTERELISVIPRVIAITHAFSPEQRDALSTCVETMALGMAEFQDRDLRCGLATLNEMGDYCYYVAGVVGEMLTRLFCHYSPEIAVHRDEMMQLAVSFGQGLQMTNILKDLWDDHDRGVCWLPQELFINHGYDLATLHPGHRDPRFKAGYRELIGIARGHLHNALRYTLLIPAHETGMREFCLWALGMAIMTLRKVDANLDFKTSGTVKISRNTVKATILATRITRRSNILLKLLFALASSGLPKVNDEFILIAPPQASK